MLEVVVRSLLRNGWSETQVVVVGLLLVMVIIALLSFFVIAPECEKHWQRQEHHGQHIKEMEIRSTPTTPASRRRFRHGGHSQEQEQEHSDTEAFSDDDTPSCGTTARLLKPKERCHCGSDTEMEEKNGTRRMSCSSDSSKSDAVRDANLSKAEIFRRRVLLRILEKEIDGAIQETRSSSFVSANVASRADSRSMASIAVSPAVAPFSNTGLRRGKTVVYDKEYAREIQAHSVECCEELEILARGDTKSIEQLRVALHVLHDVLSFYLSVNHRDMNKVTVFCNSLLHHDGLNHLRGLQSSDDTDIRFMAQQLVEKAVPLIWH